MQDKMFISATVSYNRNMSKEVEKKSEQVLLNLAPSTFETLSEIAASEDRPNGYVARELMLRGLYAYLSDGRVRINSAEHAVIAQNTPAFKGTVARLQNAVKDVAPTKKTNSNKRTQTIPVLKGRTK